MKKWTRLGAAILTLTLCLVSGGLLLNCMKPMEDRAYDLSLMSWEGEGVPEGWVYDQKGWTVFTQEGDAVTELAPDGFGGFDRLDELGQTFYFSRVLSEDADSPPPAFGYVDQLRGGFSGRRTDLHGLPGTE